jgi:hypothetical protein
MTLVVKMSQGKPLALSRPLHVSATSNGGEASLTRELDDALHHLELVANIERADRLSRDQLSGPDAKGIGINEAVGA